MAHRTMSIEEISDRIQINYRLVYTDDGWRIAERIIEHAYFDGSPPEGLEIPE